MSKPICINCITGHLLPGEPTGSEEKIGEFNTYVARPTQPDSSTTKAVVAFTDVFGLGLKNNKIVADLIAQQTGFTVYVPDLFHGKALNPDAITMPTTAKEVKSQSLFTKVFNGAKLIKVVPWMLWNLPWSKSGQVEAYVKALKETKGIEKLGAVGYCYGGFYAVNFNGQGLVDATVACHPSFTKAASYDNLKAPIMFNCAEIDDIFPDTMREQVQKNLDGNSKAPAHDFKVFPNTVHGFCARPNFGDELSKKGFEEATQRTADWFKAHL